ncbi:MAG TPA: response regulator, partial [Thermoanaerobaculia bacterium]
MPDPTPTRERIVLIDDSANDLQVTKRFLERRGFDVSAATSGEEGLALAQAITPAAFIVDYRMPVMDGLEVTRRIKADPVLQTIPVLMLTGADAAQTVVEGLEAGADDFVTKGSDTEILLARLRALLRMKRYQDQLRKLNQQITRDLQIARRVQEALVPNGFFRGPRIEIRSAYIPSATLSGDFYDYFLQDELMYLFVADVSGHGLPASILVALLKSYIHTESDSRTSLSSFMASLNDFLFSVSLPTQFATAQLFRIDNAGNLVYSNAAHPPFLLLQKSNGKTVVHEAPGHLL